jgi:ArsR family transcriptional regulator
MKKDKSIKKLAENLCCVSDENRIAIILFLKKGEKCVCEIWKELNLPQNLVSHHLKVLKNSKFISSRKEGLKVFYALEENKMSNFCCSLEDMFINKKEGKK